MDPAIHQWAGDLVGSEENDSKIGNVSLLSNPASAGFFESEPGVLFRPRIPVSPTQGCARRSPGASFHATGSRLMRAGDAPAPARVASTTFRLAVLGSVAPAWGGVSGLGSHGCRVAFCLPTHRGVQFRFGPAQRGRYASLTAGHGCAGNRRTGLVASSSTAFRSTRTLSATGWARCAGRGSGSHCARPLRVATGRRARVCRPRPWNRCAGEILIR